MANNPAYPKGFITPSGKAVSVAQMARALEKVRANRDAEVSGWEWYSVPGWMVLRSFRAGLDDRINARGGR